MEDSKKKPIMIAAIMACLVVAVVITYMRKSGNSSGYDNIKRGEMMWVKCNKPGCGAEYQIDKKDYHKLIQERTTGMFTPPLVCKECGEESVYQAVKCEKCGIVFFHGTSNDFADRCPECSYSKEEADRKAAAEARRKARK